MTGTRRPRLMGTAVLVLGTALLAGACGGSGSGETSAPTTALAPPPTTTAVGAEPTTVPPAAGRPAPGTPGTPASRRPPATTVPGRRTTPTPAAPAPRPRGPFPGYFPAWDWDGLARLERAVADGHQPWLLDPVMVASSYLSDTGREGASVGPWSASAADAGRVSYTHAGVAGSVRLAKPAGSSLWVVTSSDTSRLAVLGVDRAGGTIRILVSTTAKGNLTGLAGPFASEWLTENSAAVGGGTKVQLDLVDGEPAGPQLLRLRHQGADGVVTIAERRV